MHVEPVLELLHLPTLDRCDLPIALHHHQWNPYIPGLSTVTRACSQLLQSRVHRTPITRLNLPPTTLEVLETLVC
jgi:hypothetical protein